MERVRLPGLESARAALAEAMEQDAAEEAHRAREAVAMYTAGATLEQTTRRFAADRLTVKGWLKAAGVPLRAPDPAKEAQRARDAVAAYAAGATLKETASRFQADTLTVKGWLDAAGVPTRPRGGRRPRAGGLSVPRDRASRNELAAELRRQFDDGALPETLAMEYGITLGTVLRLLEHEDWCVPPGRRPG